MFRKLSLVFLLYIKQVLLLPFKGELCIAPLKAQWNNGRSQWSGEGQSIDTRYHREDTFRRLRLVNYSKKD